VFDSSHFLTIDEAGYETGGKSNDNANTSSRGHDRYLAGYAMVKVHGFAFGPGASWSKLYTPAYSKTKVHPKFGVSFPGGAYVSRITVLYVHPGTDWMNGVSGFEGQGYWVKGHFFLRMMAGGYWAHITVTDRSNKPLTQTQKSQHIATSQAQALIGWRF